MGETKPAVVLGPEDGASYWQPVPANGHVIVKLTPEVWDGPFSLGVQVVAPGCYIRKHIHDHNREVVFVWQGKGTVTIEGVDHAMEPGTVVCLPMGIEHMFTNTGQDDLKLIWTMAPHGLEQFFAEIGRPRTPGEPTPEPFPRPDNVLEIEARTVFRPSTIKA